ncbi:hypothetical protein BSU04_35960 [Caballeronia sordidicola]|jgi:hypothetical protein|uniref:Uncharacterized protein n=1 Tax=Caballeronia sordidicola TaxID=196367 RepID=A0A226WRY8_CABSO|nr:hypothetical protein BSU04_35960 [Caballeronia sordidicola]
MSSSCHAVHPDSSAQATAVAMQGKMRTAGMGKIQGAIFEDEMPHLFEYP